jgi:ABC-type dipeptide/oligopeptide/nickel transport system ATPase component
MTTPLDPVLEVSHLTTTLSRGGTDFTVVDDVSFTLMPGRSLAIVGESGAGKSMLIRSILGVHAPGIVPRVTGEIRIAGTDPRSMSDRERRRMLGTTVGMIHQDPLRSLNPTVRVGAQLVETLTFRDDGGMRGRLKSAAVEAMRRVGFHSPENEATRWPHELSGGQRQRIGIAAATITQPALLIGDEPTTALDVTVQRRVLDLIDDLRRDVGSSLLLVTHDLAVAAERCDEIAVMRAGRIVEYGPTEQLLSSSEHPYTRALLASIPRLDGPRLRRLPTLSEGPLS